MEETGVEIRKIKEVTGLETDLKKHCSEKKRNKLEINTKEIMRTMEQEEEDCEEDFEEASNLSQESDDIIIHCGSKKENFQFYFMQSNSRLFLANGN